MGKRVHVAKRYTITYGFNEGFNWKEDEFVSLLELLDCSVCRYQNEDYSVGEFEVSKEEYKRALNEVKRYVKDPDKYEGEWCDADDMRDHIEATGYEPQELQELMQAYWREADKRDGYLHFASW